LLPALLPQELLFSLANTTPTSASCNGSVVFFGFLSRPDPQSLRYALRIVACSPSPQLPRHILKSSSRKTLLGRLHGALERSDLILVGFEKVLDVDLAIGVRVASGYRGDGMLRSLLESGAFNRIGRACGGGLLSLPQTLGHGATACRLMLCSIKLTRPTAVLRLNLLARRPHTNGPSAESFVTVARVWPKH
jgi:hypothetical protein